LEQVDAPEITSLESSDSIPAVGSSNGPTVTSREKETTSHGLDEFETAFKTESVSIPGSIPLMDHGLRLVEQEKDSIFFSSCCDCGILLGYYNDCFFL